VQDKRFDKTKDEAALLICFLFDHFVSTTPFEKIWKICFAKMVEAPGYCFVMIRDISVAVGARIDLIKCTLQTLL
jgi:hypothetical protein